MSEEANAIIVLFAIVSFVVHFALIGVAKVWRWWHSRSEAEHRAQVRAKWDELRAAAADHLHDPDNITNRWRLERALDALHA